MGITDLVNHRSIRLGQRPGFSVGFRGPLCSSRPIDLLVDRAFGNAAVNMVTFGIAFAVVALVRYSQRTT